VGYVTFGRLSYGAFMLYFIEEEKGLIVGNWKMNGLMSSLSELQAIASSYTTDLAKETDLVICPPATLLSACNDLVRHIPGLTIGAQDCHTYQNGSYTGDISASMLADVGATHVILGHSERRIGHCETEPIIRSKIQAAWSVGLIPIVCIGETWEQYTAGNTFDVIWLQLQNTLPSPRAVDKVGSLAIAYEPIWAIGSGLIPNLDTISRVVKHLRMRLQSSGLYSEKIPILYGGSIRPDNASDIFLKTYVDGGIIGASSLLASDFMKIVRSYRKVP